MKRKKQWLALLTALCLMAGLAVLPASAAEVTEADITRLEQELNAAKEALETAEADLETAETNSGVKTAKDAADAAEAELNEKSKH